MDNMRTRFVIAVTNRLAAAAESTAKIELIEELSENLYSRYHDLASSGMSEMEAYEKAMEELGSVDELLAYLDSLGPEGELPRQEGGSRDFTSELLHGVEGIVRETVNQTKDAVDQAAVIVRNVADKLKEKYPDGFKGKVYVHFDGDGETDRLQPPPENSAEAPAGEDGAEKQDSGWSFSVGYNRNRGGFFCEGGRPSRRVEGTAFDSAALKGIDVQVNGDVNVRVNDDPQSQVVLDGDLENLELRLSEDGVLSVRQGNTAASSFFFFRGLASADVELTIPKRFWDFIQISTVHGDVEVDVGLEAGQLSIKTSSGDAELNDLDCQELIFHSASGDLDAGAIRSNSVLAETSSGELQLTGGFGTVRAATACGDVELAGNARELHFSSSSGDLQATLQQAPEQMELHAKSGDCEVRLPGEEGFTLQFSTVSGELDSDFDLVGPIGKRSGEALYLDGGGRTYRISSVSGDITLRRK